MNGYPEVVAASRQSSSANRITRDTAHCLPVSVPPLLAIDRPVLNSRSDTRRPLSTP